MSSLLTLVHWDQQPEVRLALHPPLRRLVLARFLIVRRGTCYRELFHSKARAAVAVKAHGTFVVQSSGAVCPQGVRSSCEALMNAMAGLKG